MNKRIAQVAAVALILWQQTACILITGGADVSPKRASTYVAVDAVVDNKNDRTSVGITARVRGGVPSFFDIGAGLVGCKYLSIRRVSLCGQGMLLELGTFDGRFQLGALSPSAYVQYRSPSPFKNRDSPQLLSFRIGVGYDVRLLRGFQDSQPYLFLGAGVML